ncbi:hypothetical protein EYF80_022948 [Liparis tanakae]|uniref:Uncharacterized protein n=1 Tax=Liparis tanakae TaxID=230148 RepID=A0A4Z2HLW1_9TELE|nr:hypothetical protein EYF80_022948 [Liparis tanakae]
MTRVKNVAATEGIKFLKSKTISHVYRRTGSGAKRPDVSQEVVMRGSRREPDEVTLTALESVTTMSHNEQSVTRLVV